VALKEQLCATTPRGIRVCFGLRRGPDTKPSKVRRSRKRKISRQLTNSWKTNTTGTSRNAMTPCFAAVHFPSDCPRLERANPASNDNRGKRGNGRPVSYRPEGSATGFPNYRQICCKFSALVRFWGIHEGFLKKNATSVTVLWLLCVLLRKAQLIALHLYFGCRAPIKQMGSFLEPPPKRTVS